MPMERKRKFKRKALLRLSERLTIFEGKQTCLERLSFEQFDNQINKTYFALVEINPLMGYNS
jgi:hypothetical protein